MISWIIFYSILNVLSQYIIVMWLLVQFKGTTFVYHIYFRFVILLDVSSSIFYGGGPGRNKSMYRTILFLRRSFNGRWCVDSPLIISRNDKDYEDFPYLFRSLSLLIVFSSFTPTSFSCTSKCHLTIFVFYFCSSYIFHLRACVNCEKEVRS